MHGSDFNPTEITKLSRPYNARYTLKSLALRLSRPARLRAVADSERCLGVSIAAVSGCGYIMLPIASTTMTKSRSGPSKSYSPTWMMWPSTHRW